MRPDLRSAAIGGLAATLVVAAAFAPRLLDSPDQAAFRPADDTTSWAE